MIYRSTIDEIAYDVDTHEHPSRISAIIADQEDSGWVVRSMRDVTLADGLYTITGFASDRGHRAFSVIGPDKGQTAGIVEQLMEEAING